MVQAHFKVFLNFELLPVKEEKTRSKMEPVVMLGVLKSFSLENQISVISSIAEHFSLKEKGEFAR